MVESAVKSRDLYTSASDIFFPHVYLCLFQDLDERAVNIIIPLIIHEIELHLSLWKI